ncbi:MAG: NUDIX domain-containing protein [Patescibacteria group bacterium]
MGDRQLKTKSAGGVVVNPDGKILVVSQRGVSWFLPKGHIEDGEDALTAARREIYEESGVDQLEFVSDLGSYERYRLSRDGEVDESELKNITVFLFKTDATVLRPIDSHNPEARWIEKENVADLLTHPKDKEFFKSILGKI